LVSGGPLDQVQAVQQDLFPGVELALGDLAGFQLQIDLAQFPGNGVRRAGQLFLGGVMDFFKDPEEAAEGRGQEVVNDQHLIPFIGPGGSELEV